MNRHFYISDNLDDLEQVEHELEATGIHTEQIHVLSEQNADLEEHDLHGVPSLLKKDVVKSSTRGALIGAVLALVVLAIAYLAGWTETAAGWSPFILLSAILLGFCAWEGGFFGIQQPNSQFRQFAKSLHQGRHVFFVDVEPDQEAQLFQVLRRHPDLQLAGTGTATPQWLVRWQHGWNRFRKTL